MCYHYPEVFHDPGIWLDGQLQSTDHPGYVQRLRNLYDEAAYLRTSGRDPEAARIDGANEFYIFHKIVLPMSKNGIFSIAIFQFLWTWEDFLWPYLVITNKDKQLLAVGLKMFNGQYSTDYGALFAATAISIIPVLLIYLFFQKQFIAGIAASAVKG